MAAPVRNAKPLSRAGRRIEKPTGDASAVGTQYMLVAMAFVELGGLAYLVWSA